MEHEIVVGNIGCVYSGKSCVDALEKFQRYAEYSESQYGRASGESVTWFVNGEMYMEIFPPEESN